MRAMYAIARPALFTDSGPMNTCARMSRRHGLLLPTLKNNHVAQHATSRIAFDVLLCEKAKSVVGHIGVDDPKESVPESIARRGGDFCCRAPLFGAILLLRFVGTMTLLLSVRTQTLKLEVSFALHVIGMRTRSFGLYSRHRTAQVPDPCQRIDYVVICLQKHISESVIAARVTSKQAGSFLGKERPALL